MYIIIRLMIGLAVLALGTLVTWKRGWFVKKSVRILLFVGVTIATTALYFLPAENALYTFASPEAVYRYIYTGDYEIVQIVEGGDTALVVAQKDNAYSTLIVPRGENGWKIGLTAHTRLAEQYYHNGVMVRFTRYRNTDSCYVSVFHTDGGEMDIRDSENSDFLPVRRYDANMDKTYVTYYAYVDDYSDAYTIWVNGEQAQLLSILPNEIVA